MHQTKTVVMTRERTWALTIVSLALFVILSLLFGGGVFGLDLWRSEDWIASPLITYLLMLVVVLAGWQQARGIPEDGVPLRVDTALTPGQVNDPVRWRLPWGCKNPPAR